MRRVPDVHVEFPSKCSVTCQRKEKIENHRFST